MNKADIKRVFPTNAMDYEGMTLRDYFAGKALEGMISKFDFGTYAQDPLRVARWAYEAADAMLIAREE